MSASSVVIVSPALADANNGNWRTAERWRQLLCSLRSVRVVRRWPDEARADDGLMLALHARRSAASIHAWSQAHPGRGLAVVLTGTDLYQDIATDADAQRSLQLAQRLVVLQEAGGEAVPPQWRSKVRVVFQSTAAQPVLRKPTGWLRAVMVGHLREVKSPRTLFAAARLLRGHGTIRIDHIGDGGDAALADQARATALDCPAYRWLGALPYAQTRRHIQRAHVLVHTSALEGGAHVIMEAVRSGTPVLASRVAGNVGMLGADYDGYFPHGDAEALARRLLQCHDGQSGQGATGGLLQHLRAQCEARAALFEPAAERAALMQLLDELDHSP